MPASISEAFKSPFKPPGSKDDAGYNDMLSKFFPDKTENAPAPYTEPEKPDLPPGPPVLREQMPLYTGPSAHPMRSTGGAPRHDDCHAKIADILACPYCREKLKALLKDGPVQTGGGVLSDVKSADMVNMFLILGMMLIIHKLFLK